MKRPSQRFIHKRSLARSQEWMIRWIIIYAFGARNRFSMSRLVLSARNTYLRPRAKRSVACARISLAADHHRSRLFILSPARHPFRISAHEFPSVFPTTPTRRGREKGIGAGEGTAGSTDSKRKVSFFPRRSPRFSLCYPFFFLSFSHAVQKYDAIGAACFIRVIALDSAYLRGFVPFRVATHVFFYSE